MRAQSIMAHYCYALYAYSPDEGWVRWAGRWREAQWAWATAVVFWPMAPDVTAFAVERTIAFR